MKTLTTLLLLFTIQVSSQYLSRYDKGFDDGFKKGYCHNKNATCFSPIPPVSPPANAQEDDNSYSDGFARGVAQGFLANNSAPTTRERKPIKRRTEYVNPYNANLFGQVATTLQNRYNAGQTTYRPSRSYGESVFDKNYRNFQKAKASVNSLYAKSFKYDLNKKQRKKITRIITSWSGWQQKQRKRGGLGRYNYLNNLNRKYSKTFSSIKKIMNE